jgi:hypothetical protein
VSALLGDLVDELIQESVLIEEEESLSTPGIVLLPVPGYWLFVSRPTPNNLVYVGDDSIGMLLRQSVRRGGSALDLCTGPGLQALAAAGVAASVDAVEVNPVALAVAELNVAMNGLGSRIELHLGDLYEPVRGKVFDNIIANPPFLPVPDSVAYPFVGHGSADGLRLIRRILAGLPQALAPDGVAQLICALPSDGTRPITAIMEELSGWCRHARFDLLITITCHLSMAPGSYFFEGLARTAAAAFGGDVDTIREDIARSGRETGSSHTATCFLMATPGNGQLRLQDLSHPHGGLWFV